MSITVTNIEKKEVFVEGAVYDDEILTAAGAATYPAGTVLGRVTASGKLAVYNSGGADGTENPIAVLDYEVVFAGAGDKSARVAKAGVADKAKLTEFGTGVLTAAKLDALVSNSGIVGVVRKDLSVQDNQ